MLKKHNPNPVKSFLKDVVDDFFDVVSDSDGFKEKLTKDLMKKSKFVKKLAKELKKVKKKIKNLDLDD